MKGPSVFPPQPAGLWRAAFNGRDRAWTTSRRRGPLSPRALHVLAADDSLSVDDDVRRAQPRNLLGPPHPHQHAAAGVRDAQRSGLRRGGPGAGPPHRARRGRLARGTLPLRAAALPGHAAASKSRSTSWSRSCWPNASTIARMPRRPTRWRPSRWAKLPPGIDEPELAAWTVVANVLLNLDGVLTKG